MEMIAMTAPSSPEQELKALIADAQAQPARIASFLDGLSHAERVSASRSLGARVQAKLWHKVDGFGPLSFDDFVPRGTPALTPVRHYGRNSQPAFTIFEKRFYRTGNGDEVAGANFQAIQAITGPGYFVCGFDAARHEVLIDYSRVPTVKPEGFLPIRSNDVGLARVIYRPWVDVMRRVSTHVTIGQARRKDKWMGFFFVLCREQP
ncbi:MAG TPA: hypothetical protein VF331_26890 [Polyangiales bacterium]